MALSGEAMLGVLAWKNGNHRASRDLDGSKPPPDGKGIAIAQAATRMARRGRRARGFLSARTSHFRVHRLRGPGDTRRGNSLVRGRSAPGGFEACRDERVSERNRPAQVLESQCLSPRSIGRQLEATCRRSWKSTTPRFHRESWSCRFPRSAAGRFELPSYGSRAQAL